MHAKMFSSSFCPTFFTYLIFLVVLLIDYSFCFNYSKQSSISINTNKSILYILQSSDNNNLIYIQDYQPHQNCFYFMSPILTPLPYVSQKICTFPQDESIDAISFTSDNQLVVLLTATQLLVYQTVSDDSQLRVNDNYSYYYPLNDTGQFVDVQSISISKSHIIALKYDSYYALIFKLPQQTQYKIQGQNIEPKQLILDNTLKIKSKQYLIIDSLSWLPQQPQLLLISGFDFDTTSQYSGGLLLYNSTQKQQPAFINRFYSIRLGIFGDGKYLIQSAYRNTTTNDNNLDNDNILDNYQILQGSKKIQRNNIISKNYKAGISSKISVFQYDNKLVTYNQIVTFNDSNVTTFFAKNIKISSNNLFLYIQFEDGPSKIYQINQSSQQLRSFNHFDHFYDLNLNIIQKNANNFKHFKDFKYLKGFKGFKGFNQDLKHQKLYNLKKIRNDENYLASQGIPTFQVIYLQKGQNYTHFTNDGTQIYIYQKPGILARYSICSDGEYLNSQTLVCSNCSQNCLTCRNNEFTCRSCSKIKFWQNSTCIKCQDKLKGCVQCSSKTNCTFCSQAKGFSQVSRNGTCQCLQGRVYNQTLGQCKCLILGCSNCSQTECLECNSTQKFVINPQTHKCQCVNQFYLNPNSLKCQLCNSVISNCESCQKLGNETVGCLKCSQNYTLTKDVNHYCQCVGDFEVIKDKCVKKQNPDDNTTDNSLQWWMWTAIGGGALILITIIVVVAVYKFKKSQKLKSKQSKSLLQQQSLINSTTKSKQKLISEKYLYQNLSDEEILKRQLI